MKQDNDSEFECNWQSSIKSSEMRLFMYTVCLLFHHTNVNNYYWIIHEKNEYISGILFLREKIFV
jgi:hypothetical protein